MSVPPDSGARTARLDETQRRLAEQYIDMALAIARKYSARWPGLRDDFESDAMLALVEVAARFDPDRGVKYSTLAYERISGAMKDRMRDQSPRGFKRCKPGTRVPNVLWIETDDEDWLDGLSTIDVHEEEMAAEESVRAMLSSLPWPHRRVAECLILEGRTHAEVAEIVGCPHSRVRTIYIQALDYLNEYLKGGQAC